MPLTGRKLRATSATRRYSIQVVQCPAGKLAGFFMRFMIRDVLWLTVVVALGLGWWQTAGILQESRREHLKDVQDYKRELAAEVERYEELWQSANDPRAPADPFRGMPEMRRRRHFPPDLP